MRPPSLITKALAGAIETSLRDARRTSRKSRLRRHLARLPDYVARDVGMAHDQDQFVNFADR